MTPIQDNQLVGRNRVEVLRKGEQVIFKKWILGTGDDRVRRIANLEKWNAIAEANHFDATPKLLQVDHDTFSLEYEYVEGTSQPPDYETTKHSVNNLEQQKSAIKLLARIHRLDIGDMLLDQNDTRIATRGVEIVNSISIPAYASASGAELEFLRLVQNDPTIVKSCRTLTELRKSASPCALAHGDFRPDQLIYSQDGPKIIDFEEVCIAPPEMDIASYFAALMFTIFQKTIVDCSTRVVDLEHLDTFMGTEIQSALDCCFDVLGSLLDCYYSVNPCKLASDLLTMELSWALFERVLSRAKAAFKLSEGDKAIMGIAKELGASPNLLSWKEIPEL